MQKRHFQDVHTKRAQAIHCIAWHALKLLLHESSHTKIRDSLAFVTPLEEKNHTNLQNLHKP